MLDSKGEGYRDYQQLIGHSEAQLRQAGVHAEDGPLVSAFKISGQNVSNQPLYPVSVYPAPRFLRAMGWGFVAGIPFGIALWFFKNQNAPLLIFNGAATGAMLGGAIHIILRLWRLAQRTCCYAGRLYEKADAFFKGRK